MPPITPAGYYTGHVRHPNKEHLQLLSSSRNRLRHQRLEVIAPPPSWDSRTKGWIGPIVDQGQCGSCHSADTEVLTEDGWVAWPDYNWRTPIGTMSPTTGFLEFQLPAVQHIYDHDGPMYYYDGRSTDFALTPNHRMIWRRNNGLWRKSAIADLHQQYVDIPHATTGWLGTELERLGVGDRVYAGDDFLALVAVVISCGYVGHQRDGNGGQNNITFSAFRGGEFTEEIRALAYRLSIPEQASRPGVWYFRSADLAEWFRQNAYDGGGFTAGYKRVPAVVKCASQRQISVFLKFFGDQHTLDGGTQRFFSGSRKMIDDLQELLLRVGKRGTVEESPPRTGGINAQGRPIVGKLPELMLTVRKRDGLSVEKKNLRVEHYKGKVYCATVPNGSLVTRRNKRVLISSNCWDFSGTFVVDTAYIKAGVFKNDGSGKFSEEYTLSCGRNGGCNGDDNVTVLEWAKATGLPLSSEYGPYTARAGSCAFKPGMKLYKIDDWGFVDGGQGQGVTDTTKIKQAIMTYGCVGCAVDAGFSDPGTGVISGRGSNIDHDVGLCGWDDSKGNGGAWIMRNSWGTGWGAGGYAWIEYGAYSIGTEAVFGTLNVSPPPPEVIDWTP